MMGERHVLIDLFSRRGHHGRALEEAVLSHKSQWPFKWKGANPLHGGKSFENMTPQERVCLPLVRNREYSIAC
jgi:hypothetical protein